MSYCTSYRNYSGLKKNAGKSVRCKSKGRKKKIKRLNKAWSNDGCQRKKSNGLAPMFRASKKELDFDLSAEGY